MEREIKFKYTTVCEDGRIFEEIITLEDLEEGGCCSRLPILARYKGKVETFKRQYTSYKDRSGREVYGGDVVQIHGTVARPPTGVIRFIRAAWFIGGDDGWRLGGFNQDDIEVIGDIHQNPGLSEDKP